MARTWLTESVSLPCLDFSKLTDRDHAITKLEITYYHAIDKEKTH